MNWQRGWRGSFQFPLWRWLIFCTFKASDLILGVLHGAHLGPTEKAVHKTIIFTKCKYSWKNNSNENDKKYTQRIGGFLCNT